MELNVIGSQRGKQPEKKLTNIQRVILAWKILNGIDIDNKGWDQVYFRRYTKPAKDILLIFNHDLERINNFMSWFIEWCSTRDLDFTFETMLKHVHTYQRRAR